MLYPVYVHVGDDQYAHSVTIPDFPGCFSAADEWDDLPTNIQEAVELHIDGEEMDIPEPSPIEAMLALEQSGEYEGGLWMLIDIDMGKLDTRKERRLCSKVCFYQGVLNPPTDTPARQR